MDKFSFLTSLAIVHNVGPEILHTLSVVLPERSTKEVKDIFHRAHIHFENLNRNIRGPDTPEVARSNLRSKVFGSGPGRMLLPGEEQVLAEDDEGNDWTYIQRKDASGEVVISERKPPFFTKLTLSLARVFRGGQVKQIYKWRSPPFLPKINGSHVHYYVFDRLLDELSTGNMVPEIFTLEKMTLRLPPGFL